MFFLLSTAQCIKTEPNEIKSSTRATKTYISFAERSRAHCNNWHAYRVLLSSSSTSTLSLLSVVSACMHVCEFTLLLRFLRVVFFVIIRDSNLQTVYFLPGIWCVPIGVVCEFVCCVSKRNGELNIKLNAELILTIQLCCFEQKMCKRMLWKSGKLSFVYWNSYGVVPGKNALAIRDSKVTNKLSSYVPIIGLVNHRTVIFNLLFSDK